MTDHMNEDSHLNHSLSIMIKAALIFPIMWIVLTVIYDVSFVHSTFIGIVLLLLSYVAGDIVILPKMGNGAATSGDLILGVVIVWGGLQLWGYGNPFGTAVLTGAIVTVGEYFFHAWMLRTQYVHKQV